MIPLLLGLGVPAAIAGGAWVASKGAEISSAAHKVAAGTETSAKLSALAAFAAGAALLLLLTSDSRRR